MKLTSTHRDQHMQKSAHISSIATRLNNLEQKFDDFEDPSSGGDNDADIERIVKNTFGSATDDRSVKWQENTYYFDGRTDMSAMIWGAYGWNPQLYESCAQNSFYQQTIGHGYETEFGKATSVSLAASIFGNRAAASDFVKDFAKHGQSFAQSVFGTRDAVAQISSSFSGSLYEQTFGADPSQVSTKLTTVSSTISPGGSERSILDVLVKMSQDLQQKLSDIDSSLSSLSSRVSALE